MPRPRRDRVRRGRRTRHPIAQSPRPDPGQLEPVISGDFLAYTSTNPVAALSDESHIALKYLGDDSAPYIIPTPDYPPVGNPDFKDMEPAILYDSGSIYVIWTRYDINEGVGHLWIWKGTYGMPIVGGANTFLPDATYPKTFMQGPEDPVAGQSAAAIGLVPRGGEQHVVAAWQDSRDTCPGVPEVFWLDLTDEPSWSPTTSGLPVDSTGVLGRGQYQPTVGATGIYWLDERFSWWDDGNLTDTAVYRLDLGSLEAAYYLRDTDHSYDNGLDSAPQTTAGGALWLRTGPYGSGVWAPYLKPLSGSPRAFGPIAQPLSPVTFTRSGATSTGLAIMGKHGNSASAVDYDIFYFDTTAGVQVPVCDRSVASSDADPDYFKGNQMMPAIGNAFYAYRVVWADQRDSAGEDSPDAKLYEAFVPTVTWTIRPSTILNLTALRSTVTVKPDFTGEPVMLQRMTPVKKLGRTYYKPLRSRLPGDDEDGGGVTQLQLVGRVTQVDAQGEGHVLPPRLVRGRGQVHLRRADGGHRQERRSADRRQLQQGRQADREVTAGRGRRSRPRACSPATPLLR